MDAISCVLAWEGRNGGGGAMAHRVRVRDLCAGQKETRRFREGRTGTDIKISGRKEKRDADVYCNAGDQIIRQ